MQAMLNLHLDPSLAVSFRHAPATTSRYPPHPGEKRQFSFQQQQQLRARQLRSLRAFTQLNGISHDALKSPILSPTSTSSAPQQQQQQQLFSPSVSPSHSLLPLPSDSERSFLANRGATVLSQAQLPDFYHHYAVHAAAHRPVPASSPSSLLPLLSSAESSPLPLQSAARSRERRTPSFTLDKFLTSNQHLSTVSERLHAICVLKKDPRLRSAADAESLGKFLQTIEFLSTQSLAVCCDIARVCRMRKYNRDEIVYREGDDATHAFVIMTGAVGTRMDSQLSRHEEKGGGGGSSGGYIAGVEYAGSSLGSDSFSSSLLPRYSSTRLAVERSELLSIDMSDYSAIMRIHQREEERQRMHLLKHIKAFELCTAAELWHIAQHLQPLRLSKNQLLFTQGEKADKLYFVQSGECRAIYTGGSTQAALYLDIGRLRQYHFIGELGMFTADGCRSCTVYTESSCLLYFMRYDDVRTRVPPFVIQAMKEWGDTLYGQQANDELQQQMQEERRWKRWKARILQDVRRRRG